MITMGLCRLAWNSRIHTYFARKRVGLSAIVENVSVGVLHKPKPIVMDVHFILTNLGGDLPEVRLRLLRSLGHFFCSGNYPGLVDLARKHLGPDGLQLSALPCRHHRWLCGDYTPLFICPRYEGSSSHPETCVMVGEVLNDSDGGWDCQRE